MMNCRELWKEVVAAYSNYFLGVCLDGLRVSTKTSIRLFGVPSEFRTDDLPNSFTAIPTC
jgi:hypothetical protein